MTNLSCLYNIQSRYPDFSKKEKKIADFIIAHPTECIHPSIDDLAFLCEVSETTLFRFVRKLGYESYQQFRIALAMDNESSKKPAEHETNLDASSMIYRVFSLHIESLQKTMQSLDHESFEKALDYLVGAKRLTLYGLGGSGAISQDAFSKLIRIGVDCVAPIDFHFQILSISRLCESDAALLFAFNGMHPDAILLAQKIKKTPAKLVFVTNYNQSPITGIADVSLFSTPPSSSYTFDRHTASIALYAVVDCIYQGMANRLGENADKDLQRAREVMIKNEPSAFAAQEKEKAKKK